MKSFHRTRLWLFLATQRVHFDWFSNCSWQNRTSALFKTLAAHPTASSGSSPGSSSDRSSRAPQPSSKPLKASNLRPIESNRVIITSESLLPFEKCLTLKICGQRKPLMDHQLILKLAAGSEVRSWFAVCASDGLVMSTHWISMIEIRKSLKFLIDSREAVVERLSGVRQLFKISKGEEQKFYSKLAWSGVCTRCGRVFGKI